MCWFSLKCLDAVRKFSGGGPKHAARGRRPPQILNADSKLWRPSTGFADIMTRPDSKRNFLDWTLKPGYITIVRNNFRLWSLSRRMLGKYIVAAQAPTPDSGSSMSLRSLLRKRLGVHYLCCVRLIGRTRNIIMPVTWTLLLRQSGIAGLDSEKLWPTWSMMRRWGPPRILQTSHRQKKKERRIRTDGHLQVNRNEAFNIFTKKNVPRIGIWHLFDINLTQFDIILHDIVCCVFKIVCQNYVKCICVLHNFAIMKTTFDQYFT